MSQAWRVWAVWCAGAVRLGDTLGLRLRFTVTVGETSRGLGAAWGRRCRERASTWGPEPTACYVTHRMRNVTAGGYGLRRAASVASLASRQ